MRNLLKSPIVQSAFSNCPLLPTEKENTRVLSVNTLVSQKDIEITENVTCH